MPESLRNQWDGNHWRRWAALAGVVLVGITLLVATAISFVREGEWLSLALVGLTIELLVLGITGSGMVDGLASRAIAGGMARQPLPDSRMAPRVEPSDGARPNRDRRTIRTGLVALPVFITFLVLLYA